MQTHFLKHEILRLLDYMDQKQLEAVLSNVRDGIAAQEKEMVKYPLGNFLAWVFVDDKELLIVETDD
jgi:hypothetical protein